MRGPIVTAVINCINSDVINGRDVADHSWRLYVDPNDLATVLCNNKGRSDVYLMEKLAYRSYIARHAYDAHKKQTTNIQ